MLHNTFDRSLLNVDKNWVKLTELGIRLKSNLEFKVKLESCEGVFLYN